MTYDKPEIRDFGSIADHTYDSHFGCVSGQQCDGIEIIERLGDGGQGLIRLP